MEKNERIIKNIVATNLMEGYSLNAEDVELINKCLKKDITEQEALDFIKSDFLK